MKQKTEKAETRKPDHYVVVIETPRGSRNKYKYNEETGGIKFAPPNLPVPPDIPGHGTERSGMALPETWSSGPLNRDTAPGRW